MHFLLNLEKQNDRIFLQILKKIDKEFNVFVVKFYLCLDNIFEFFFWLAII